MVSGYYGTSGSSTVIENLATALEKKGVDVTIGAFSYKTKPSNSNLKLIKLPLNNFTQIKHTLSQYDIIHSHHAITNYLSLLFKGPFIYHYHGAPNTLKEIHHKLNMVLSIVLLRTKFTQVIAVSSYGASELRKLKVQNIKIIYNGVDLNLFKPNLGNLYRIGKPQYLFVGNLYSHKNVGKLIYALKKVKTKYPKATLQIIGEGSTYSSLKNIIQKNGLDENVKLLGSVSNSQLPYYYSSCDAYVTASHWELFGLPLIEAMACGKPFVASSIPAHLEILEKSSAGLIYQENDIKDLSNKLIKIYQEKNNYITNAINYSKKFDWSYIAEEVYSVYQDLINSPKI